MTGSQSKCYDKQILTARDFYGLAQEGIYEIKYFYVSRVDITETEVEAKEHFSNGIQIPDTFPTYHSIAIG
jgi:hypothetical protein